MIPDSVQDFGKDYPDTQRIGWKDGDHNVELRHELVRQEWVGQEAFTEFEDAFLVPVGYNGIMIACVNPGAYHAEGVDGSALLADLVSDDTLWFRLN